VRGYGKEVREKLKEAGWAFLHHGKGIMMCGTTHGPAEGLQFQ